MIILLSVFIIVFILLSLPAWIIGRKKVRWYIWDFGVPVYAISLWFFLVMNKVGTTATLSNFVVEVFLIFIASFASPWLRFVFPGKSTKKSLQSSFIFLLLPIIATIFVRLLMPSLPE